MKQFDLTPGDSRDYQGIRVTVVAVGERRQGGNKPEPVVTVCVESLEPEAPEPEAPEPEAPDNLPGDDPSHTEQTLDPTGDDTQSAD